MIVVCATDRYFVELAGAMLRSLHVNGALGDADVIVLGDRLRRREIAQLTACHPHVSVIDITAELKKTKSFGARGLLSKSSFSRLYAPDILGPRTDRLLYLDSDVIVRESLEALCELSLDGKIAAAVPEDQNSGGPKFNARVGRPLETPYFNSGVLLIDTARWKAAGIGRKAIDYAERTLDHDQNALNYALHGSWLPLDKRWNGMSQSAENVAIIHFWGKHKPHMKACRHQARSLFLEHRRGTPWRDSPLLPEYRHKWSKLVRKLAVTGPRVRTLLPAWLRL